MVPHIALYRPRLAHQAAAIVRRGLEPGGALAGKGGGIRAGGDIHGIGNTGAVAGAGGSGIAEGGAGEASKCSSR